MSITRIAVLPVRRTVQRGVTLIELVIFIVVVSIAVVGLLQIFTHTTASSADPQLRKQALAIAEAMLDEIEGARFTFCDPIKDPAADTAQNAALFHIATNPDGCTTPQNVSVTVPATGRPYYNVSDYVRALNTGESYKDDVAKKSFPDGYKVSVTISPDAGLGPSDAMLPSDATPVNMNVLRITVTVTYGANQHIVLAGYRTRYAGNAVP
ncbi:MSHA pilin protein MshD [Janthinobacterium sp. 35]|uniref:prepilin-type N-terminal cleavage/methylation domain-containing protein n=1 Tax=Janthinobacterium sp. 35 TaxID=2035210 RepID=UPI000C18BDC1|nr:prepilin-type N-terminal cleavage/methylation domain-containing protein [Janthinobacterium sp. 35]PIG30200.1 MSHA pilin protein MshD [Janthinobacterium sp. 35]